MTRTRMMSCDGKARHICLLAIVYMVVLLRATSSRAGQVGVNYGRVANDLPTPSQVAQFVSSQNIGMVKIFDADTSVIQAFANTQIKLTIALPNEQLQLVASDQTYAYDWLTQNVTAYYPASQIVAIAVGNEILTSDFDSSAYLVPAMVNLHLALVSLNLDDSIKISSPHSMAVLESSYPPSAGRFNSSYASSILSPFFDFLISTNSFGMVNVYPFFAYSANPTQVPLNYALFLPTQVVTDPNTGLQYNNLFDAQVDAFFAALTALNSSYANIPIAITETGWPSLGDANELGASVQNAQSYNANLLTSILSGAGTPMRPNATMDAFVFALFNENEKPGPTSERNYGLFFPNLTPVYSVDFTTGGGTIDGNTTYGNTPSSLSPESQPTPTQPAPAIAPATATATAPVTTTTPAFCIAKSDASTLSLQAALDYACGPGGADCTPLQPGNSCYDPNTIWAHASYAFNSYYQMNARAPDSCFFGGNAVTNSTAPSTGTCTYPTG